MVKIWKYFISDKRANVAVTFGVSAVVLAGLAGGAVDYSKKMTARNTLQGIADSAALSAAREFQLAGAKRPGIEAVAKSFIDTNMKKTSSRVKSTIAVSEKDATVDVTLSLSVSTPFMSLLGMGNKQVVTASSRARIFGGLPLCVLALEETEDKAIGAYSQARLTATGCSVYANSTDEKGIEAEGNARLNTGLTCSAGGARGGTANYTPAAVEDCPKVPDPLASRARPPFDGTCTFNDVEINGGIVPLSPGTYCGGLRINDDAVVVFQPGDYIIKD
ncbi:MAG TPA: pilus assembly protein, partial [Rhizobiales bacterium]|nr:pilus assembly protein [Hyphomicrobiales bacterium]